MSETSSGSTYTCRWCRESSEGTSRSCPWCGAPVDVRAVTTTSGWEELPPIPDMARLQFGQSTCQIEGTYVPVADVKLAEGASVQFGHHVLLWQDESVALAALPMKGGFSRLRAGIPLVLMSATGPGHVALSEDEPGEIVALPLDVGQQVETHQHRFLLATEGISYSGFPSNIYFTTSSGDDSETHYPLGRYMDRFYAERERGIVLLHAAGNTFARTLDPGEQILVHPRSLLFKDPGVRMMLHAEYPAGSAGSWGSSRSRTMWLRLTGPGRVAVQSVFPRLEDNGNRVSGSSGLTVRQW